MVTTLLLQCSCSQKEMSDSNSKHPSNFEDLKAISKQCSATDEYIRLDPIYTDAYPKGNLLNFTVPDFGRQDIFRLCFPEVIAHETGYVHFYQDATPQWKCINRVLQYEYTNPQSLWLKVELRPGADAIDIAISVKNLGSSTWPNAYAFNCLNPVNAPSFYDPNMARTWSNFVDKGLVTLDNTHRVFFDHHLEHERGYARQGFRIKGRDFPEGPTLSSGFGISNDIALEPFMAIVSKDGQMTMGAAVAHKDAAFLWNNTGYSCIHAAYSFGDVAPGEKKRVQGRLYFIRGGLRQLYQRYKKDFSDSQQ